MRKADAAELILSLVTSRDRAASIAGDLLEDAEATRRFWGPLARIAVGQWSRQISTEPSSLVRRGFGALLLTIGVTLIGVVLFFVAMLIAISIAKVAFGKDLPDLGQAAFTFAFYFWVNFTVGRSIARRWPGREAAVSFSLVILMRSIALGAELLFWIIQRHGGDAYADIAIRPVVFLSWYGDLLQSLILAIPECATDFLTLVAGAAYQRAKALRSTAA